MYRSDFLPPSQACFEPLEPRILLASDLTVLAMSALPDPVTRPELITLTVDKDDVHPSWTAVKEMEFYRDANGDGELDIGADEFLGSVLTTEGLETWSWAVSTASFPAGANRFFARPRGNLGWRSHGTYADVLVLNAPPVVEALIANPNPVVLPAHQTLLTAYGISDPDGTVVVVAFYRDVDGDQVLDASVDELLGVDTDGSDGWRQPVDTTGLAPGGHAFFAIAQDNEGLWSTEATGAAVMLLLQSDEPPVIGSLSADPDPVTRPAKITLTAHDVQDPDGTVVAVAFFRDANGNGTLEFLQDELLGYDINGSDGWSLSAGTGGFEPGSHGFFAVAHDNDGNWGQAVSTTALVLNAAPSVEALVARPNPVVIPASLLLSAYGVSDPDGTVATVAFYRDADGDQLLDTSVDELLGQDSDGSNGWGLSVDTSSLASGTQTFFALAQDNDGQWSEGAAGAADTVVVDSDLLPVIGSLSVDPDPVTRPAPIVLTAQDVSDPDGSVVAVAFFRDANGNGQLDFLEDELLGEDINGSNGWSLSVASGGLPAGSQTFFAVAHDDDGNWGSQVSATALALNASPSVEALTASPSPVTIPEPTVLNAYGVSDPDGSVAAVAFYRDVDGDKLLNTSVDELLDLDTDGSDGWSFSVETAGLARDVYTFFALAQDNDGQWSDQASAPVTSVLVKSDLPAVIGSLSADPDSVTRPGAILLTAQDVEDPDGVVVVVAFYRDADGDGLLNPVADELLGEDLDGSNGWSVSVATGGFPTGSQTFLAAAHDNDGNWSTEVSATAMILNAVPVTQTLVAIPDYVIGAMTVTLMATASDADGQVVSVEFYFDTDGDGLLTPGVDSLLGVDSDGSDGWLHEFSSAGLIPRDYQYLARALDGDGEWSEAISTGLEVGNLDPVVASLIADPNFVYRPDVIVLTAQGVYDPHGQVEAVAFYRDADGDGLLNVNTDILLGEDASGDDGWTWQVATDDLRPQEHRFFARAVDDNGVWSLPVSAKAVVDLMPVAVFQQGPARVLIYDLIGEVDISAADIRVKFSKDGGVRLIKLGGKSAMEGLGVMITGATWVGKVRDGRRGELGDVSFIASDAPIKALSIKGDLAGWDLNGVRLAGVQFEPDVDLDGRLTDLTGVYVGVGKQAGLNGGTAVLANSGKIGVRGTLGGDVVVAGGLTALADKNPASGVDVVIGSALSSRTQAKLRLGELTDVSVRSWTPIKSLAIKSDFRNSELVLGENGDPTKPMLGKMTVSGWIDQSAISALGDLGAVITGAMRNSSIAAGVDGLRDDNGDGVRDLFDPAKDLLAAQSAIAAVKVRGLRGQAYSTINSNIMAHELGKIDLRSIREQTDLDEPFGVAGYSLASFIRREADGTFRWPGKDPLSVGAPPEGNFVVELF